MITFYYLEVKGGVVINPYNIKGSRKSVPISIVTIKKCKERIIGWGSKESNMVVRKVGMSVSMCVVLLDKRSEEGK